MLNVLIACEESQAVCKEFRRLGHRAFSCDIQECSGGHPEWHIQGDVLPVINGRCSFEKIHSKGKSGGYSGNSWLVKDENGRIIPWNDPRTAKARSKTYEGIARAMAEQWSEYLEKENKQ